MRLAVHLNANAEQTLRLREALDLLLASLALGWPTTLLLGPAGMRALATENTQAASKGFASLPIYDLACAYALASTVSDQSAASQAWLLPVKLLDEHAWQAMLSAQDWLIAF